MKTIRFNAARQFALVMALLTSFVALLAPIPAKAADQTDEKVAGIIGIIRGQTARLNLVNIGDPSIIPPGPCVSRLTFLDGANNLLGAAVLSLAPGQASFADLNADLVGIRGRIEIHGIAHFAPNPDPTLDDPCANTRLTLEVFDNKSMQTTAFAPEPHLADPPEPEKRFFGMVGITAGQELRLSLNNLCDGSVIHLCDGSVTPAPCDATVSFLDVNGRDLITPVVLTLTFGGETGFVDLLANHGIIINDKTRLQVRGLVSFPPLRDPTAFNPCANVRPTVEVFGTKGGQTTVFYGVPDT
jgi:hypothetical protein